jgi:hypothetical protein
MAGEDQPANWASQGSPQVCRWAQMGSPQVYRPPEQALPVDEEQMLAVE